MRYFVAVIFLFAVGCSDNSQDECMTDEDCSEGQECVITHDHEGDDHNHGGSCEDVDTAQ